VCFLNKTMRPEWHTTCVLRRWFFRQPPVYLSTDKTMYHVVETSEGTQCTALDMHWTFTHNEYCDILLTLVARNDRRTSATSSWTKQLRISYVSTVGVASRAAWSVNQMTLRSPANECATIAVVARELCMSLRDISQAWKYLHRGLRNILWLSVGSLTLRGVSSYFQTILLNRYLCAATRLLYFDPLICFPIRCDVYLENCRGVSYNIFEMPFKMVSPYAEVLQEFNFLCF